MSCRRTLVVYVLDVACTPYWCFANEENAERHVRCAPVALQSRNCMQERKHIAHRVHGRHRLTACSIRQELPPIYKLKDWIWDSPFHRPRSSNKSTQSLNAQILLRGQFFAPCLHDDLTNSKRTKDKRLFHNKQTVNSCRYSHGDT